MDTITKEPKAPAVEPSEQGYQLTIARHHPVGQCFQRHKDGK